jgi:hypothetical protein
MYRDINGNINVAGNAINMASRVMNLADNMQIMVSEGAYRNIIDMTTDTNLEEKFRVFKNVGVKHGVRLDVFQYCAEEEFVNRQEPEVLDFVTRLEKVSRQLLPGIPEGGFSEEVGGQISKAWLALLEGVAPFFTGVGRLMVSDGKQLVDGKVERSDIGDKLDVPR